MRKAFVIVAAAFLFGPQWACQAQQPKTQKIRPASVAGQFYPADPAELTKLVDQLLAQASVPPLPETIALVAPHAGYMYSAQVAAHAYATLKGRKLERVVVIAPSHIDAFPYSAVYDGDAYTTPLGAVPVDKAFAASLAKASRQIQLSSRGHEASGGRAEHALEVQLPFLQRVLGRFQLVPIIMGDQSYETSRALGLALASSIRERGPTVIVASSDLSHYHNYDQASRMDRSELRAMEEFDYLSLWRNNQQRVWEACGAGPVVAAMIAAERLGATRGQILKYANSGDVTGDRSQVVGYGAVVFYKEPRATLSEPPLALSEEDKAELFRIAHLAVETAVKEHKLPAEPSLKLEALSQERGAFVTLKIGGQLRGCIGYVSPIKPLAVTVRDVAASAAVEDSRFQPVSTKELPALEYEISVLSPMRHVMDVSEIKVGRDGLLVKQGPYEGLLLPQVPVEQGWDRKTFLEQTCRKAGLLDDCWKDSRTDIFRFTALVFCEHEATPAARAQGK